MEISINGYIKGLSEHVKSRARSVLTLTICFTTKKYLNLVFEFPLIVF
jgi:hypothetical protein